MEDQVVAPCQGGHSGGRSKGWQWDEEQAAAGSSSGRCRDDVLGVCMVSAQ